MPEQLSENALCTRINQQLRKRYGFSLRKTRGNKAKQELGIYFVLDELTDKIIRWHIEDLSAFYRDLMDFDEIALTKSSRLKSERSFAFAPALARAKN
jgi:hypothetical protein